MIRVAIVDDHPVVADGLGAALGREADVTIAWTAGTIEGAKAALGSSAGVDKRGAAGFLLKLAPTTEIVDAVHKAASGGLAFEARHLATEGSAATLSRRELDVVRLVAGGLSNDEVAGRIGISRKTVEAYLTSFYERLEIASRTELALWAEREGWLELGPGEPG